MIFMRMELYPPLEPFAAHKVAVGGPHVLHVEQCGNPNGFPVFFLHGGPGSQARPVHRRFFDPRFYRIVLFDQRGCGRSTPLGCTDDNTTARLVEDIERLRAELGLARVLLFGGSWGSTLALAYGAAHPDRVAAMVLRGIFLGTRREVDAYLEGLRREEGGDPLARYHAYVNQRDEAAASAAAQRWLDYEEALMSLGATRRAAGAPLDRAASLARVRVQLHYLVHDCFLAPGELLSKLSPLARTPLLIVQGELDRVCPADAARTLASHAPGAELRLVARGGHAADEPEMAAALRAATDELRGRLGSRQ
jgi:proline iminopeptidase